jgi:cytoskeletal protein CcmA (bactofilin family)
VSVRGTFGFHGRWLNCFKIILNVRDLPVKKVNVFTLFCPLTSFFPEAKFVTMTDVHSDILEDEDFDTILSEDIDFSGTLNFEKSFLIRGKVSGEIAAGGLLVIDGEAVVNANISASRVIIRGQVKGNVTATEKVEVTITGKLVGNVAAPEIFMETGCLFNGRCTMTEKTPR